MAERFDGLKRDARDDEGLGFPEKVASDLLSEPARRVIELGESFKSGSTNLLESAVKKSALVRCAVVTAEGLVYAVPGAGKAIVHNLTNLPETGFKVATAATIGVGLRLLLPEKGAARALTGTVMGAFFVRDALRPFANAYKAAWDAKDLGTVHKAAEEMGDGLGMFAVDSVIGIKVGKWAEGMTGRALKSSLGPRDYAIFEAKKENFWNSDTYWHGRALNWVARKADWATGALAERLIAREGKKQLPLEEALRRVEDAGKRAKKSIEDRGFYKYGPEKPVEASSEPIVVIVDGKPVLRPPSARPVPERMGFSEYLDALEAGKNPLAQSTAGAAEFTVPKIEGIVDRPGGSLPAGEAKGPADPVSTIGREHFSGSSESPGVKGIAREIKTPGEPPTVTGGTVPELPKVEGQAAVEFDPANVAKLAAQAQRLQKAWSEEAVQVKDLADGFKNPQLSVSDATRKGAVLGPEYDASMKQIVGLSEQIRNAKDLQEAGLVLDLHAKAAMQLEARDPIVVDQTMFARELDGMFRAGIRKAGISDDVFSGRVPSVVAHANDNGYGNFAIPEIDGVIDRPLTLFPRNQTKLVSVLTGINRHEQYGHIHAYGQLARFPAEFREKFILDAVKNAMAEAKVADVDLNVPGLGVIKKSEFFKRLLIAQANENTADIVGTASGAVDTPLSLGVLLQSLRKGGLLEHRNVMGREFPDFFEPHGVDVQRFWLASETMRQLAPQDKLVLNLANALDSYAARASRPTSDLVWLSQDSPGQSVSIPRSEVQAVVKGIVKAQLDTPLESLEGKTFRQILPDMSQIARKIDTLATLMADAAKDGTETIPGFDKSDYTVGQVFSAGLLGWLRLTARGENEAAALTRIDRISESLRALYRESNPHVVPLSPSPLRAVQTKPIRVVSDVTGRILQKQTDLRNASAAYAMHMGSAATYLMMEDILRYQRLKRELEKQLK